jgi:4-amino-4-deoxy-L-arabinose transferase-like glycosyltransferase
VLTQLQRCGHGFPGHSAVARPQERQLGSELLGFLPPWSCNLIAALLILGTAAAHFFFLIHNCPLDLAPDEAHYWDWSRHLDWSYYSKGPLVAYLIRGSCELFGAWSMQATGNLMAAVRLPAVLCGALLLWSLYLLALQVYGRHGLALTVVALALTLPLIAAGSSLMTIDSPYCCCWGWAMVFAHRAIFRRSTWAWPLAGFIAGLGVLAKYTMVLWLPSVGLFLLTTPALRRLLWQPGFWIMTLTMGLSCFPIVWWNMHHDWVSFFHVKGLTGDKPGIQWMGPLVFLEGQCAVLLVYWFLLWVSGVLVYNPWRERDPGVLYLWWLSVPMFVCFLTFGFTTGGGELNWPVTAYLSGTVLAVAWLEASLQLRWRWFRYLQVGSLALACVVGMFLIVVMHRSELIRPTLAWLVGPGSETNPTPLRRLDPTCRLRGWQTLAAKVDELREELRARGEDPVLAGSNWSLPGELGFYCKGQPQVYSIGLAQGDRHSQYDFWPGPTNDPAAFRGRTFLIVGVVDKKRLPLAFEKVEPQQFVVHREGDHKIAIWGVTIAHGFKDFPPWETEPHH